MSIDKIISSKIDQALQRHGLPLDSPIRGELDRSAVIGGGFQPEIMIRHGDTEVTPDQRIGQLRNDPNFRDCFPATRTISRHDQESMRVEFDAIARGTTVVV